MATVLDRVGSFYRFAENGPLYQVLGPAERASGEPMMRIRVLDTGEEADVPLGDIHESIRAD